MPELPEVEAARLQLATLLHGRAVRSVRVHRRDIVHGSPNPRCLLRGSRIDSLHRRGKQLAIIARATRSTTPLDTPCLCFHFGMTGSLRYRTPADAARFAPSAQSSMLPHVTWTLDNGDILTFHDPRRFGGIWPFPTRQALQERRWARLGPDALAIRVSELRLRLAGTARGIKAALLDQQLISGLGNIYADEVLFAARIHPLKPACSLDPVELRRLARTTRRILGAAVQAGGSTIRDYVRPDGSAGRYQHQHRVYGRQGLPCPDCQQPLTRITVTGRSTVYCPSCQGE